MLHFALHPSAADAMSRPSQSSIEKASHNLELLPTKKLHDTLPNLV